MTITAPQSGTIGFGVVAADGSVKPVLVDASGRPSMSVPQSVPLIFTGNVPLQTGHAYILGDCLGGLITITGLTPGVAYLGQLIALKIQAASWISGPNNISARIFEANPTTSTFVDGSPAVLAAADKLKAGAYINFGTQGSPIMTVNEPSAWFGSAGRSFVADGGGQLYMAWVTAGAQQMTAPSADYRLELRQ